MTKIKYDTPFVFHCRNTNRVPYERGGLTIVFDPTVRRFGVAECSKRDNYNRKMGLKIALGRAKISSEHFPSGFEQEISEDKMNIETVKEIANGIAKHYGYIL
jgi:hypothetical protein